MAITESHLDDKTGKSAARANVKSVRGWAHEHPHTLMLTVIVTIFFARPALGIGPLSSAAFGVALLLLLLVELYSLQIEARQGSRVERNLRRNLRRFGLCIGIPALIGRFASIVSDNEVLVTTDLVLWLTLTAFVTFTQILALVREKNITADTISLSVSVYLLIGLTWTFIYGLVCEFQPNAINFGSTNAIAAAQGPQHIFPVLGYFSLATLTTTGFGDIVPVTLQARFIAVFESITGQFYLAIMVARLVGMQLSQGDADKAGR